MLDIQSIRKDFPILDHKIYDKPLIYFDNGATTQKPRCVVEKIESGYYNVNANIHRGVHFLSQAATEAHEDARRTVQQFLNARSSNEIIFTRGTTEAINLIASSFTDECMSAGDEVIVSVMEHHSNIVPWQIQAARKGIALKVIPMNEKGELCMDTFRSLFPLLNLMYPSQSREMQEGLLNTYRESGFFPEWASPGHRGCMVGNNSASVLTDAYLKGVKVGDAEMLYEGLVHGTQAVHPKVSSTGRLGYEYYNRLGYVPYDVKINESAARTLEYAYDDWCISRLAAALGKPRSEVELYEKRAMNYRNLFDPETRLMRGRNRSGAFMSPFSPLKWGDAFTEGNSWHYTWSVFHDPQGLVDLMGGPDGFVQMLDSVFNVPPLFDDSYYGGIIHEIREMQVMNMGNYAHGNQPVQHMIYLYDYAGQPWKAQYWLREVMNRLYNNRADGYCGDEDNGQTSAWYVFSALGFYPVCPGTDQYVMGAPLFRKAVLRFENGKLFTIEAPENGPGNRYIRSASLNGEKYTKNYLTHGNLLQGGKLQVKMDRVPNKKRGIAPEDFPYSFSTERKHPVPPGQPADK